MSGRNDDDTIRTLTHNAPFSSGQAWPGHLEIQRFSLLQMEGDGSGQRWEPNHQRVALGSHASNEVVIDDRTVSRFHCEIRADQDGLYVSDLDSHNGLWVDGVRVTGAWLREGSVLRLGNAALQVSLSADPIAIPISEATQFGGMVGASIAMRQVFAILERCAKSTVTVLVTGETGTGKEMAAEAIHGASKREDGPLIVVDCGAIPPNLLESELFGHERGSFTGAVAQRVGAFEAAHEGTIFLDEIGELPLDLQPKLLRALEQRTIRRVGSNERLPIDVRVVAATNRNLRVEVNEGRFRPDLYYRLAVIKVEIPPLRERIEDLPLLVEAILRPLGADEKQLEQLLAPAFLRRLANGAWPGNIRELRNHLERCMVLDDELPIHELTPLADSGAIPIDVNVSYSEARRRAIEGFERRYLTELLRQHDGNVSQAARAAGMDRVYLHRLLRRNRVRD